MNITELFIKRPVATALVMLAILVFGVMSYFKLPVSDLPNVDFPTIMVSASLPGASPETMASSVATPLERQFSTISGISSMSSTNQLGSTQITIQFDLDRNIDAAAQDVQTAITQATRKLPSSMPNPPSFRKVNPADQPILFLALYSGTLPISQVDEYAETLMAQRISMVPGVAQVMVYGAQKYAVRVQLDPRKLAARQLGIDEVASAVSAGNVNLPTGTLMGPDQAVTVQAAGQLYDAAAYRPLIVAYRDGAPVRLEELGRVIDSVDNDKTATWFNDTRAVVLAIQRQPGTNTVAIVDEIIEIMPKLRALLPPAVSLEILYDRSQSIRESVADVKLSLLLAVVLVVLVIFLFLRNLSATVIPSMALPMSIVGTFAVMALMSFSLDNLSLMALILCVGFVVDDAIVMLENIVRHLEMGKPVMAAALEGAREIGFTIISMTLSLAAVFIPVLFMGGLLGRLLNEFAMTIITAILVSGFVSLSLTPMLCSRYLKPGHAEKHGSVFNFFERVFDATLALYERTLKIVLRFRRLTLVISLVILLLTGWLFGLVPKGFLPADDTGMIRIATEGAQGISFDAMVSHQKAINDIVQRNPHMVASMSNIGFGGLNQGFIAMRLKPRKERPGIDEIIAELRPQFAAVPGITAYPQNPAGLRVGGMASKSQYQFTLQSPDMEALYKNADELYDRLKKIPELTDVATDLYLSSPQLDIAIDRDQASALGVTAEQIENALYTAYGDREVSDIYTPNNDYQVIMEVEPRFQREPSALNLLYVRSSTGSLVPLNAVARMTPDIGPFSVNHLGQIPSVTLSFNLAPGVSLGTALERVEAAARGLPQSISTSFQGTAQAFEDSMRGLGLLLALAILVIYIVLGILYESFIHPLTILSGLPAAGVGALLTLLIFRCDLDIYSFVGIIMLVGIVKKNAIMMIDFAIEAQRKEGRSAEEAIFHGCLVRFRPIMMTTVAAIAGTLPIALGLGAGGETRRSLGLAVVGGLCFSQLITLYLTPVMYLYMEKLQAWTRRKRA